MDAAASAEPRPVIPYRVLVLRASSAGGRGPDALDEVSDLLVGGLVGRTRWGAHDDLDRGRAIGRAGGRARGGGGQLANDGNEIRQRAAAVVGLLDELVGRAHRQPHAALE